MDHELKQRLIGAVVVTALAAIFIPMLFDDPVDNSTKKISEFTIPDVPASQTSQADNLPADKEQVLNRHEPELKVSEFEENPGNEISPSDKSVLAAQQGDNHTDTVESGAGSDIQEKLPNDKYVPPSEIATEDGSGLDTGDVDESGQSEAMTKNLPNVVKQPTAHVAETIAKKTTPAEAVTEKAKSKSYTALEKEKSASVTAKKEASPKTGSKLVRWSLQAGSFSKKENAQAVLEKLRKQGFPATLEVKGNLYRIKIGPELDKKKAVAMKTKLASQKIQSYLQSE